MIPADVLEHFALRMRVERHKRDMSLRDLATAMGTSNGYLSQVENAKYDLRVGQAARIADAIGVRLSELLP